jgi:hypothetical protein
MAHDTEPHRLLDTHCLALIDAMNRRRSSQAVEELVQTWQPFQEGRAAAWNLPFSSSPMVVFGVCHILSSDGKPRNLTAATPPSRSLPELWVHDRRRVAFI